jgi:hypothetical protein
MCEDISKKGVGSVSLQRVLNEPVLHGLITPTHTISLVVKFAEMADRNVLLLALRADLFQC